MIKEEVLFMVHMRGLILGNGSDLCIRGNFINGKANYSNFPSSYKDTLGKGKSIFTGDFNISNTTYNIKEVEVFKMS